MAQGADFQRSFPHDRKPFFENNGHLRLKYWPENSDISLEARQNQVKRRNDSRDPSRFVRAGEPAEKPGKNCQTRNLRKRRNIHGYQ
jgi:hypothetical protein